ncbi:MAG: PAS domain S-box protein [Planctomycetes bacterium]|nr:PAS domain S-box protein [Planctomycetota bacterium]
MSTDRTARAGAPPQEHTLSAKTGIRSDPMQAAGVGASVPPDALLRSAERLRESQAIAHLGSFHCDASFRSVEWSDGLYRIFGLDPGAQELTLEFFLSRVHPEDRQRVEATLRSAVAKQREYSHEYRIVRSDRELRWLATTARVLRDEHEQFAGLEGTCQDITERKRSEQTVEAAEQLARATLDAFAAHICVLDSNGVIRAVNRAWREYADAHPPVTPGYGVGCSYFDSCESAEGPESSDAAAVSRQLRRLLGGEIEHFEVEYACSDSEREGWYIARFNRFHAAGSAYVLVFHEDVTEQRLAEKWLREQHSALTSAMPGVSRVDAAGKYEFVSAGYAQITGYTVDEMVGKDWTRNIHPDDVAIARQSHERMVREGQAEFAVRGVRKDGRVFHEEVLLARIVDAEGRPRGHHGFMRDVTEKRAADERERKASALREALIRTASDGICVCHAVSEYPFVRFTIWNERMRAITGYTIEEINRLGWYQTVYPDATVREAAIRRMEAMRLGDDIRAEEWPITAKNGEQRTIAISTSVIGTAEGEPAVVGIMHDTTERRRAEEERKRLELHLQQAQRLESIGRLAGGVAHDFNNLLTVIFGHCALLRPRCADAADCGSIDEIRQAAEQAAALTRQLLAFGRQSFLSMEVINPNDGVRRAVKLLRRIIGEDIALEVQLDRDVSNIRFDPTQFTQLLMNLAVNSRDAMPRGGRITISTARLTADFAPQAAPEAERVVVTFGDDGEGMTPEVLGHLFEPFFTTKGQGKGAGLGLAVVHGIVAQSGGTIEAESRPGAGARFRIVLPAVKEAPKPTIVTQEGTWRGDETVLLVEDSDSVRQTTATFLRHYGYTVVEARDACAALRVVGELPRCDLLLTDMVMPGMSGYELAAAIRAVRSDIGVLLMSGYSRDALDSESLSGIRAGFISKPFAPSGLARSVREELDRRDGQSASRAPTLDA